MSIDSWLGEATPRQATERVCLDGKLLSQLETAKARLMKVTMLGDEEQLTLRAEVERLEAEVRDKTHDVVFESIGWGPWRALVSKHPPSPDMVESFQKAINYAYLPEAIQAIDVHMETFVPAALAATCAEPGMTLQQAEAIVSIETGGLVGRLFGAVLDVNVVKGSKDPFVEGFIASVTPRVTERK